jgi:hypothetical protein
MICDGTEGGQINLDVASAMTAKYRKAEPSAIRGRLFGKDAINALLNQTGCMGIRIYYGLSVAGEKELILVGTDASGNDMTQLVMDMSKLCPPYSSIPNSLNSDI